MPVLVPLLTLCAAAYGAAAGSLLPRAAYRLAVPPQTPWRGRCPAGHELTGAARGWLGRARCRACPPAGTAAAAGTGPGDAGAPHEPAAPFGGSPRLFAAVCASVCVTLALFVGPRPELGVWLLAAPFGLLLAAVDLRAQRLPDILTLPLAVATAALLGLAALAPRAGGEWTGALLGGAVLAAAYFVMFLLNPRGMGFGDVKLAAALGLALGWYGWNVVFAGTFLGFLLAACYGLAQVLAGRAKLKTAVPFGPFMLLGTLAGVLLGGATA
ncbi:A24 family peptidase [Streptomyces sp. WMMB 322]|uniref:prepilin peptidase n=1 Tax=Streptomyces sp. WMMB 322 TaxID=1286821 RepID=UPI0006E2BD62|nr:A24 family peptidase [Streptomyces sp. WMMB 322]SCK34865.1 leader peptidase (prepilin peptidase) / N-methyltransferase [Streptomyces sp. WMMB 322]